MQDIVMQLYPKYTSFRKKSNTCV